ncbi:MAG: flagellar hook protein FlgE [Synergistetes bacterium]|nr:flagellar hook protein FlgE [Synergistota bacterium]
MLRSLYSGISGLKNHLLELDVIGNNISNVNTVGFKKSRVTFKDVLYQTLRSAMAPTGNLGGINPMEVGMGMQLGAVDTIFTQGTPQMTGKNTDMMIQGDGFFVLSDGAGYYYTRAGAFAMDSNGTFVDPATGYVLQGWVASIASDGTVAVDTTSLVPIQVEVGEKLPGKETSRIDLGCNLDASASIGTTYTTWTQIYDSLGNTHDLKISVTKVGDNQWFVGWVLTYETSGGSIGVAASGSLAVLNFGSNGLLDATNDVASVMTIPANSATSSIYSGATLPQGIRVYFAHKGDAIHGVTQFASDFTMSAKYVDGYPMGVLKSFTVDQGGLVSGVYSNGRTKPLYKLAIAVFSNPAGLNKAGNTLFTESYNSGTAQLKFAGSGGAGVVLQGYLEMSNVDIAEEFVNMIVAQRGFQANTRVITTADESLRDLLALKR